MGMAIQELRELNQFKEDMEKRVRVLEAHKNETHGTLSYLKGAVKGLMKHFKLDPNKLTAGE